MASRQAACDPCRRAKLACDHKKPACTRCEGAQKSAICIYRNSPFQRRRTQKAISSEQNGVTPRLCDSPQLTVGASSTISNITPASEDHLPSPILHRNPGYLGSSSHTAIFDQIDTGNHDYGDLNNTKLPEQNEVYFTQQATIDTQKIAEDIKNLFQTIDVSTLVNLVQFWLAKGVNLALSEPFVPHCLRSTRRLLVDSKNHDTTWHSEISGRLLQNSQRPLVSQGIRTISDFAHYCCCLHVRFEALGIFLTTVARAIIGVPYFHPLYTTRQKQIELRSLVTALADRILVLCLSLDSLNDLQLVFQYENWILHSHTDGDQSLQSWRRLGDVLASASALGYHDNRKTDIPVFLIDLRRSAYARLYSADKNVSIFLGRPPRLSKRSSCFQIPLSIPVEGGTASRTDEEDPASWHLDSKMSHRAETRWSALCASLKEEILEQLMTREANGSFQAGIEARLEAIWEALPASFRLPGPLRLCDRSPFETDFLVSARLNYLHVQFLLHLAASRDLTDPADCFVGISIQMLGLVVEVILRRHRLASSGTGLSWKVAHYGLPAAGIVLSALLKQRETLTPAIWLKPQVWQDLTLLAGEIQIGTLVEPGDPNYALLVRAARTIQRFLDTINVACTTDSMKMHDGVQYTGLDNGWDATVDPDSWNSFDFEVWNNLSGHPLLAFPSPAFQG